MYLNLNSKNFKWRFAWSTVRNLALDGAAGKCYVKFPWLWPPIMLEREGGKKGRFVLRSQSWSTALRRYLHQLDLVSILLYVMIALWTKLKYLVLYTLINSNIYVYSVPFRIIILFWRVHLSLASHKFFWTEDQIKHNSPSRKRQTSAINGRLYVLPL